MFTSSPITAIRFLSLGLGVVKEAMGEYRKWYLKKGANEVKRLVVKIRMIA